MSRYGTIAVAGVNEDGTYEVLARGDGEDFDGNGLDDAKDWIKGSLEEDLSSVKIIREVEELSVSIKTKRVVEFEA